MSLESGTKLISNSIFVSVGMNKTLEVQFSLLLPRCLSLPTCIRPSWWKRAARGSATEAQFQINVTRRADFAATVCVCVQVEEVTMRFVIHFVSVDSIIHPGGQRASNMPGTACDRVQQLWSEIFMRHFCVGGKKKANPGIPALLTGTLDRRCALKSVRSAKQTRSRTKWMDGASGRSGRRPFFALPLRSLC